MQRVAGILPANPFLSAKSQYCRQDAGSTFYDSKSNPMSTARAECVSAPMEMKSTPVFAIV
jgi:hypothetical protein